MVVGAPRTFEKKFKFTIEIDNVAHAGFNKCSELSVEIDKVEYREGGSPIPDKSPGLVNYTDITLERGAVSEDSDLWDWFEAAYRASTNTGEETPAYKRNMDIVVRDRSNRVKKRWRINGAWITKFVAGDWDNSASENVMEMVTITYDTFERLGPAQAA